MLLTSIKLTNFLSYGDHSEAIQLEPLNVIIGSNGAGKSNLLEAIELIKSAPKDLIAPIRDGGACVTGYGKVPQNQCLPRWM